MGSPTTVIEVKGFRGFSNTGPRARIDAKRGRTIRANSVVGTPSGIRDQPLKAMQSHPGPTETNVVGDH